MRLPTERMNDDFARTASLFWKSGIRERDRETKREPIIRDENSRLRSNDARSGRRKVVRRENNDDVHVRSLTANP